MTALRNFLPAIALFVIFIVIAITKGTPVKKIVWQALLIAVAGCALVYFTKYS